MNLKCLIGHQWVSVSHLYYYDTSWVEYDQYGKRMCDGQPSTMICFKCERCNKLKRKHYFDHGHIPQEVIKFTKP